VAKLSSHRTEAQALRAMYQRLQVSSPSPPPSDPHTTCLPWSVGGLPALCGPTGSSQSHAATKHGARGEQSDKHQAEAQLEVLQEEVQRLQQSASRAAALAPGASIVVPNPFSFLASSSQTAGP
jgi:hypothetical protein